MENALVIHGRFSKGAFRADGPTPDVEGPAELIVYTGNGEEAPAGSIFDVFGKAPHLRTAEDIDSQVRGERDSWDKT